MDMTAPMVFPGFSQFLERLHRVLLTLRCGQSSTGWAERITNRLTVWPGTGTGVSWLWLLSSSVVGGGCVVTVFFPLPRDSWGQREQQRFLSCMVLSGCEGWEVNEPHRGEPTTGQKHNIQLSVEHLPDTSSTTHTHTHSLCGFLGQIQ